MFDRPFETYQIGDRWESRGRTITESDLVMFSAFSGDWYPLHADREWASKTRYGQRIAHGMLVLSVATGLMVFKPGIVLAFYGLDRTRFVRPTYIGDTLHVELEVQALQDKKALGGVVTCMMHVVKHTGEVVVSGIFKILVAKSVSS